jgi:hypothetical protein
MCNIPTVLSLSFALIFGALFAKTWRIHRIFNTEKLKVRALGFVCLCELCAWCVRCTACTLHVHGLASQHTHSRTQTNTSMHTMCRVLCSSHLYARLAPESVCRASRSPPKSSSLLWAHSCFWKPLCWPCGLVRVQYQSYLPLPPSTPLHSHSSSTPLAHRHNHSPLASLLRTCNDVNV